MKKIYFRNKSKTHGYGLYATTNIKINTKIIEYVGDKITKKEGNRRADRQALIGSRNRNKGMVYVFELNTRYDIDGSVAYNHARFINHSCNPNCEVEIINNKIWILSIKNIKKGEELSYDYGYSYDSDYKSYPCKCKSNNCVGFILKKEDWGKI